MESPSPVSGPAVTPRSPIVWRRLGNVPLSVVTPEEAVGRIAAWAEQSPFRLVVTPNVDHVVRLQSDEAFRGAYERAAMSLIDGVPLLWAMRWLGLGPAARVAGSDLLDPLCRVAQSRRWRVFILGGRSGEHLNWLLRRIADRYPGLGVEGRWPPFGFENSPGMSAELLDAIAACRPNLLLAACGAPKSEVWMDRHRERIGGGVGLGVGVALEFLAGTRRRAPRLLRRIGLEWLWRLGQEPGRLGRRYLVDDLQFFRLVWRWRRSCS